MEAPSWFFIPLFYGMFIVPVIVPAGAMAYMSKRRDWNKFWLAGGAFWLICAGALVINTFSQMTF